MTSKSVTPKSIAQKLRARVRSDGFGAGELAELRQLVDQRLDHFFSDCAASSRLGCAVRHGLLSPGKRFRPIITLLAARQSCASDGPAPDTAFLDAACAVEMVHAASLIMDDLPSMDDARLRRGALTTHVVFGEGPAMLAAIALLNEAYKVITNAEGVAPEARLRALDHLTRAIGVEGLAGGQDQDIACHGTSTKAKAGDHPPCDKALKEMEQRHREKTGALFAAAAAIGGEFSGAPKHNIEDLLQYGYNLGLAYQAFDDVVDVTCSAEKSGKDAAQDQDKSTVVSLLGRDGARVLAERHLIRAIDNGEAASLTQTSPLADLARLVDKSFGSLTQ